MKYTIENIIEKYQAAHNPEYIFFWGHTEKPNEVTKACLSQWYQCYFTVQGTTYHTTEQYMMAQKALLFNDVPVYNKIMSSQEPKQYKQLGREIKGFLQSIWDENKYNIVFNGNYAKFSQNENLQEYLISTNKKILAEASPYDSIWGIGMSADDKNIENPTHWQGENLLGFVLMDVRDKLAVIAL